jgi:cytochrome c-type biogenesis protein CcmH
MLWIILGVMLFVAVLIIAVPLYQSQKSVSATSLLSIVAVTVIAAVIYSQIGTPKVSTDVAEAPNVEAMVASLAARLQGNPTDVEGWKMLGRTYLQLKDYSGAVTAYEQAVNLESGQNAQTLADLGEVILLSDPRTLHGRGGELFENALVLEPNNPKALFYSGMAAIDRGEPELGAERWEALLATSPPPNIESMLRQRIAELRGEAAPPPAEGPAENSNLVIHVNVSLGTAAAAAAPQDATVFIIARDPAQPSPPLAAVRRRVSELPAVVEIGDADAMIPGRVPSGFKSIEILARVSMSGQPIAQPGDWFGQQVIETSAAEEVQIVIDSQVP